MSAIYYLIPFIKLILPIEGLCVPHVKRRSDSSATWAEVVFWTQLTARFGNRTHNVVICSATPEPLSHTLHGPIHVDWLNYFHTNLFLRSYHFVKITKPRDILLLMSPQWELARRWNRPRYYQHIFCPVISLSVVDRLVNSVSPTKHYKAMTDRIYSY